MVFPLLWMADIWQILGLYKTPWKRRSSWLGNSSVTRWKLLPPNFKDIYIYDSDVGDPVVRKAKCHLIERIKRDTNSPNILTSHNRLKKNVAEEGTFTHLVRSL